MTVAVLVTPDIDGAQPPPRKRVRQEHSALPPDTPQVGKISNEQRLFAPFRALGLVTNGVPFILQTRSHKGATDGPQIHILTCLGRSWALWDGGKMTLLFVGPDLVEHISDMAMDGDAVWAASGQFVIKFLRGKEAARCTNPLGTALSCIHLFGSQLLALTDDGGTMLMWNVEEEIITSPSVIKFNPGFTATSILHPATYLNKVLVASSEGGMQLWNVRTKTCIHRFSASRLLTSPTQPSSDSSPCAITALTQSPAIDVVGIGFASGEISVYDVRADERLMRLFMEGGGIKALSFRNDGQPILASASPSGHIAIWDLNSGGRLLHIVRGAHDSAVSAIEWVPGQPVLISSGDDNSVKQWLFDSPTIAPRLLKFRSGHSAPPHLIRFYGDDGKQLLTASRDRSLRCTSVVRDSRSFELSQGSLAKKASTLLIPLASLKLSPVTAISYSSARAKDWDDILTAHTNETFARTWTMLNKRMGKHDLGFEKGKKKSLGSVKAVCVTACGNFGIAGSSTGVIQMWNMQSGLKRKSFDIGPCPPDVSQNFRGSGTKGGSRCVTGLASDALNRVVIASTLDGTVNFFDFHTTKLERTIVLPSSAVSITLHRDSGLLAVVCDDLLVRIVDIETKRTVRELCGFRGRILDIAFSADSRWLVASSLDSIIRTFDLPTGCLIDAFRTPSIAASIAFSPTNDFLATAHVDSVGVYLWANRAQYSGVSFRRVIDEDVADVPFPIMPASPEAEDQALEALSSLSVQDKPVDAFSTPPQLDGDLITLTFLPRSRWQTLLNLDVIQQRNKPIEPPKVPDRAPFFLPTLPGVEPRFVNEKKESEHKTGKLSRRLEQVAGGAHSVFYGRLVEAGSTNDYEAFFAFTKTLSPAAIDVELRSLVTLESLRFFIEALVQRLQSHRDFEAVQTFQAVFLRVHADVIVDNPELQDNLARLKDVQSKESERLLELIASSLGTLGFIRETL